MTMEARHSFERVVEEAPCVQVAPSLARRCSHLADVSVYLGDPGAYDRTKGHYPVTTNCSIDFMRKPVANCDLISETRILKLGKVLAVGDTLIYSEGDQKPVARAGLTYSIPPR